MSSETDCAVRILPGMMSLRIVLLPWRMLCCASQYWMPACGRYVCRYTSDLQCSTLAQCDNWPLITGQLDVCMHDRDHHTHKPGPLNVESYCLYRSRILKPAPPRHDNRSPRLFIVITPSHSSYQITKQHSPRMSIGMFAVRGDLDVIEWP